MHKGEGEDLFGQHEVFKKIFDIKYKYTPIIFSNMLKSRFRQLK